jgi:TetR/AcrR family transcriptional repressor of lmrAB and yxaGH operons
MARGVREQMADGAAQLLATKGLEGSSFAEVLALTGAPRGSVYHHFPQGKAELVMAALDVVGARTAVSLEQVRGRPPVEVTEHFLGLWRMLLDRANFRAGCAVVAVTVAADAPELLEHAATIFRGWVEQLTALLIDGGAAADAARQFAVLLISATEGAVVLSRAARDSEPLELVARSLVDSAGALAPKRRKRTGGGQSVATVTTSES